MGLGQRWSPEVSTEAAIGQHKIYKAESRLSLFRRLLPNAQQRRETAKAIEILEWALRESRKPMGCAKSAELGADIRGRLLTVVGEIEKGTGQPAIIFAADGTLIDPRLIEALSKHHDDGELLRLSIHSCFVNPQATQYVNETWPTTVKSYLGRP